MKENNYRDSRGSTASNKPDISAPGISTPDSQMRKENWDSSSQKNPGRRDDADFRNERPNTVRSPHG